VKAGGRVVKNVAGYDLMKLQIGALGTLGVITQVTLKVKPKPEASAAVVFGCPAESLGAVLDLIHASKSRPVAVELLNAAAWRAAGVSPPIDSPWLLAVGFEEKAATVPWQLSTLRDELKSAPIRDLAEVPHPAALWSAITALQLRPESRYLWKAGVLPSKLAETALTISAQAPYLVHASALNGILWLHAPDAFGTSDHNKLPWMEQRLAAAGPHHYSMRRCPTEHKRMLRVWGRPSGTLDLMRTVKQKLDPDNVFNSGRLFGS
jgi:glycolate oxidase FAD binding subunit